MSEPKENRFRRLAEARVNKIIGMLRLLGNCSHKGNYAYTDEQITQIFDRLQRELDKAHRRYLTAKKSKQDFSLSGPAVSEEKYPTALLALPDGTCLSATAIDDENFPAINIDLYGVNGDETQRICFMEYNPERGKNRELCVGVYCRDNDETVYYESYNDRKESK